MRLENMINSKSMHLRKISVWLNNKQKTAYAKYHKALASILLISEQKNFKDWLFEPNY